MALTCEYSLEREYVGKRFSRSLLTAAAPVSKKNNKKSQSAYLRLPRIVPRNPRLFLCVCVSFFVLGQLTRTNGKEARNVRTKTFELAALQLSAAKFRSTKIRMSVCLPRAVRLAARQGSGRKSNIARLRGIFRGDMLPGDCHCSLPSLHSSFLPSLFPRTREIIKSSRRDAYAVDCCLSSGPCTPTQKTTHPPASGRENRVPGCVLYPTVYRFSYLADAAAIV